MLCTGVGDRTHSLPRFPEQRSGLGGAQERDVASPGGGLRAICWLGSDSAAGPALCGIAAVHQSVSTVVQVQK